MCLAGAALLLNDRSFSRDLNRDFAQAKRAFLVKKQSEKEEEKEERESLLELKFSFQMLIKVLIHLFHFLHRDICT